MQVYTSSDLSSAVTAQVVSYPSFSPDISFANTVQLVVISWLHLFIQRGLVTHSHRYAAQAASRWVTGFGHTVYCGVLKV